MDQSAKTLDVSDVQAPSAFSHLQGAITERVEDLNRRFDAGLGVRRTQTTFEVHHLEKAGALVSLRLTDKNDIHYNQFIKRDNEQQSGTIYVRVRQDGSPALMFPDFPHPNVQLSYQDASKRLLDSSF
jgi:hypothetical protein